MKIEKLELKNVGQFSSLDIDLAPLPGVPSNVTIFIGNNGGGKTTILRSLATVLSWFVARVRSDKGTGTPIPEQVIKSETNSASVRVMLSDLAGNYSWTLAKSRAGRKGEHLTQLDDLNRLALDYRNAFAHNALNGLPLIAFYSVERVVLDVPLKIKGKHTFSQLDGYDNSLKAGVDFRRFFEWFREREDWENEIGRSAAVERLANESPQKILELSELLESGQQRLDSLRESDFAALKSILQEVSNAVQITKALQDNSRDPQLDAVRRAIAAFMPGFDNLKVRRKPRLHMSVDKNGERLDILQLSQGEKSLMALVGDIARRLAMMNPSLKDPLHGTGVVLIDEVDMHLHPQWARTIVDRLRSTFPNCQFVLSTHSPLVISDCKDVLVYAVEAGELHRVASQYGQDANSVLLDVMRTDVRNAEIAIKLNDLLDHIQAGRLENAKELLAKLRAELPSDNLELAKAGLLLKKKEHRAKN